MRGERNERGTGCGERVKTFERDECGESDEWGEGRGMSWERDEWVKGVGD
jgi:hypothetical protein